MLTTCKRPCYYPLTMNNRPTTAYVFAKPVCPSTMGGACVLTNDHIRGRAEVYKS